jgi:hypothetical protein
MNDDNLVHTYQEFMSLTDTLLAKDIRAIEIAPILIKLGLEIYKTVLAKDEYERMVEFIYESRDTVHNLKDFMPELH